MALLECCLSNVSSDALVAMNESEHEIRETICLDRCGACYDQPFLVVNGELQRDKSHRDLLRSLDMEHEVLVE